MPEIYKVRSRGFSLKEHEFLSGSVGLLGHLVYCIATTYRDMEGVGLRNSELQLILQDVYEGNDRAGWIDQCIGLVCEVRGTTNEQFLERFREVINDRLVLRSEEHKDSPEVSNWLVRNTRKAVNRTLPRNKTMEGI